MDTLTSMGVYVRVVELKSFSLAANELAISSSSVSKQISQLENHIGAKLLQRTTRRLFVTEVGEVYYQKCLSILSQVKDAHNLVSSLQDNICGNLRITCNMTFGQLQLSKAIPEFMQRYPEVTLDVTLDDHAPDLMRDGFDLAIRIADPHLPDSSLIAREIAKIPLYICATPDYLSNHPAIRCPQDLIAHNCLVFVHAANADNWKVINGQYSEQVNVSGDIKANNSLVIHNCALAHRGIANLADFVIADAAQSGQLVKVFPDYQPEQLSVFAVYPDRQYPPPKVKIFIEFFQQWLAQQSKGDPWQGMNI